MARIPEGPDVMPAPTTQTGHTPSALVAARDQASIELFREANARRSAEAAQVMVARTQHALAVLAAVPGGLPPGWDAVGRLRLTHPGKSLTELAALTRPPTTKDTIAGILRRMWARAEYYERDWYPPLRSAPTEGER